MACRAQPRRAVTATGGSLDPDGPMAVLITGGATGIGRAIADAFLAEGRAVHICDIDGAAVEAYVDSHPKASGTQADAANIVQVDGVFDDLLTRYGALDVLVNNVGIAGPTAAVEDIEPEDWDRTIAIDLNAQFYFTRRACRCCGRPVAARSSTSLRALRLPGVRCARRMSRANGR